MTPILSILAFLGGLLGHVESVYASDRPRVTIPVNVAYTVDSLWTRDEVLRRFQYTQNLYAKACEKIEIKLKLSELVQVQPPELQDIRGWQTGSNVEQIKSILSLFRRSVRPTVIYVRRATYEGRAEPTDHLAQAYTFDGPRTLPKFSRLAWNGFSFKSGEPFPFVIGNLDWNRFDELKPLHGTTVIAQGSSEKHEFNLGKSLNRVFGVDAHELGHILLNDGSHRDGENNIMGNLDRYRFDADQCELIGSYPLQETMRESAVFKGMRALCSYADAVNHPGKPGFCSRFK